MQIANNKFFFKNVKVEIYKDEYNDENSSKRAVKSFSEQKL